jgi:plastocyanin
MKDLLLLVAILLVTAAVSPAAAGEIRGTVTAPGAKHAGDAVIFVDKLEGKTFPPPEKHPVVDQKNLTFIPHVLPVLLGTTVEFLNSDDVLHNVFCPDKCAGKFNLGTWPKGRQKSYTYTQPCVSMLLCNVHPEMEGYVVVVETPYFVVSEKKGGYVIPNVPAGTYTLKIWHQKLKAAAVKVTVPAEGSVTQDFALGK